MDRFHQILFNNVTDDKSPSQQQVLFEEYKLYVETMEKLVARRQTANSFFLAANTLLVTLAGFAIEQLSGTGASNKLFSLIGISVSGILLSVIWLRLNNYYGLMNKAKFSVIHALEEKLPAALFLGEWIALGEGKDPKKYQSMAKVKSRVALVFISLYSLLGILAIFSGSTPSD